MAEIGAVKNISLHRGTQPIIAIHIVGIVLVAVRTTAVPVRVPDERLVTERITEAAGLNQRLSAQECPAHA